MIDYEIVTGELREVACPTCGITGIVLDYFHTVAYVVNLEVI